MSGPERIFAFLEDPLNVVLDMSLSRVWKRRIRVCLPLAGLKVPLPGVSAKETSEAKWRLRTPGPARHDSFRDSEGGYL